MVKSNETSNSSYAAVVWKATLTSEWLVGCVQLAVVLPPQLGPLPGAVMTPPLEVFHGRPANCQPLPPSSPLGSGVVAALQPARSSAAARGGATLLRAAMAATPWCDLPPHDRPRPLSPRHHPTPRGRRAPGWHGRGFDRELAWLGRSAKN